MKKFFIIAITILLCACNSSNTKKKIEPTPIKQKQTTKVAIPSPSIKESNTIKDVETRGWQESRKLYIKRYLEKPKYIEWSLKKTINKKVGDFLQKGYWSNWNSATAGEPKQLELGFLSARLKNEKDLEHYVKLMKEMGGGNYYLMLYIQACYYNIAGKNDKAKEVAQKTDLFKNLEDYGVKVSKERIKDLQKKISK